MYEGIKHLKFLTASAGCQKETEKATFPPGVTNTQPPAQISEDYFWRWQLTYVIIDELH